MSSLEDPKSNPTEAPRAAKLPTASGEAPAPAQMRSANGPLMILLIPFVLLILYGILSR